MREIKYIVLHCTATVQTASVDAIQRYWKETMKWKSPGYHYIINPDGFAQNLASHDSICNGVAGYNSSSIHISYIGGVDKWNKAIDNRTPHQCATMARLIKELKTKYPLAEIVGHRDFPNVKKDCPSFDVKGWLKTIQL